MFSVLVANFANKPIISLDVKTSQTRGSTKAKCSNCSRYNSNNLDRLAGG